MPTALKKSEKQYEEILSRAVRPRELSKREREVVTLVAEGYKNREVAEKLGISVKTVETHRANIMNKLAFRNVAQLIRYVVAKGLVFVETE